MSLIAADRQRALRQFVARLGYGENMVREQFPVWIEGNVSAADLVAFARPLPEPHDMTTAAITGVVANGVPPQPLAFSIARSLASPTALIALEDRVQLWSVGPREHEQKLDDFSYGSLLEPTSALCRWLDPQSVLAAKRSAGQLALFPTDVALLLQEARRDTASRLHVRVETALAVASEQIAGSGEMSPEDFDHVSRLVIGAMAALMVNDKLDERSSSWPATLATASKHYPSYFAWLGKLPMRHHDALLQITEELGRDVTYAGLDSAVVSHVYESALVSRASRKDLGIFYTPPELAERVLRHLPIEDLPPERRIVLDPACGSGTLLLAAYDRLRELAPPDLTFSERHEYATTNLVGMDADPFAVQVASLALLLNALPQGNGWRMAARDVMAQPGISPRPSIVVSNPPWGQKADPGKRAQLADPFVRRMLDMLAPDGFLALMLPASWLAARTSRRMRETLRQRCDIFEVWRLPEDTFGSSEMAPAVLLAQASDHQGNYVFRRALRRGDWKQRFFRDGLADIAQLTSHGRALNRDSFLHGPLDRYADELSNLPTLKAVASVGRGPVPAPPVSERGGSGDFWWLRKHAGVPTLTEVPREALLRIKYPDEFKWRTDDGSQFLPPKILVSAVRKADNPWRLRTLLDARGGVVPRDSLFFVVPRVALGLAGLAAVLSSSVASCWVDTLNPSRSIELAVMESLPVPPESAWPALARLGEWVLEHVRQGRLSSGTMRDLDEAVLAAYGLPGEALNHLKGHFAGFAAPEGPERYPAENVTPADCSIESLKLYGAVLEVAHDALRLWVPDVTNEEGEWVRLPNRFLGRHVRVGATFEADVAHGELLGARFAFQPDSFLELEDLAALPRARR